MYILFYDTPPFDKASFNTGRDSEVSTMPTGAWRPGPCPGGLPPASLLMRTPHPSPRCACCPMEYLLGFLPHLLSLLALSTAWHYLFHLFPPSVSPSGM